MIKLNIEIPKWKIIRRVQFILDNKVLLIKSIDSDGKHFSIFKKIIVKDKKSTELVKEPFYYKEDLSNLFEVVFYFQGYYDEPELKITVEKDKLKGITYIMEFDPVKKVWDDVYAVEENK